MAEPTGLEPEEKKTLTGSRFLLVLLGASFFGSTEPKRASSHVINHVRTRGFDLRWYQTHLP